MKSTHAQNQKNSQTNSCLIVTFSVFIILWIVSFFIVFNEILLSDTNKLSIIQRLASNIVSKPKNPLNFNDNIVTINTKSVNYVVSEVPAKITLRREPLTNLSKIHPIANSEIIKEPFDKGSNTNSVNHVVSEVPAKITHLTNPSKIHPITTSERIRELFDKGSDKEALYNILINENPFHLSDPLSFSCPQEPENRITLPDLVNHDTAKRFREKEVGTYIFYQHLRKAGGTGFCDLASNNLHQKNIPPYYCMIDNKGSLATHPWNSEKYLYDQMLHQNYRITANEWDVFHTSFLNYSKVVFATTFRHPVDRWYSQYRFEHLEHRDGSASDAPRRPFKTWYNNNKNGMMGSNYYVNTFEGGGERDNPHGSGDFYWTYRKFVNKPITYRSFMNALGNVNKFHLILITEYLNSSSSLLHDTLDWIVPPRKVLPHENQVAKRDASSVKKPVVELVGEGDYKEIVLDNIYDLLFFHIVQRIYLERLACGDVIH